jgi:hypothetical protein
MRQQREQEEARTKAIEQLGSDNQQVRADGVYALERVTRDSAQDYPRSMEILTAFIREHSRKERPQPATDEPRTDAPKSPTDAYDHVTRPDVQAAITVIGRRDTRQYGRSIDLARLDLTGVDLTGAALAGADLTGADLTRAILAQATLRGAHLGGATLRGADLRSANLTSANLTDADLTGAILYDADLTGADLTGTNLASAHLNQATGANFTNANFIDATWSVVKPVPEGWVRDPSSSLLRRADSDADDAG